MRNKWAVVAIALGVVLSFYTGRTTVPNLDQLTMKAKGVKAGIELDSRTLDQLSSQKTSLQLEVQRLQELQRVAQLETSGKPLAYIIKVRIAQSHVLDLEAMMKDSMNACEVEIPVDKDYYNTIQVGHALADGFRMGSLVMGGSIGSWDVKVIDKRIANK